MKVEMFELVCKYFAIVQPLVAVGFRRLVSSYIDESNTTTPTRFLNVKWKPRLRKS